MTNSLACPVCGRTSNVHSEKLVCDPNDVNYVYSVDKCGDCESSWHSVFKFHTFESVTRSNTGCRSGKQN